MKTFQHHTEGVNAVNLLPISGNNNSSLLGAEAIYPTRNHGIFGVSLFKTPDGNPTTNHGVILGKTNYGKSCTAADLITQVQPHVQTTFIIESGNSHGGYVSTFGDMANTLIIDPNGSSCLNYIETSGLPLSPQHLTDVIGVMTIMIGRSAGEDINQLRAAKLNEYLLRFYETYFNHWQEQHPERLQEIFEDFSIMKFLVKRKTIKAATLIDQFVALGEWKVKFPKAYAKLRSQHSTSKIETNLDFYRFAYAYLDTAEQPTHSDFHNWLQEELSNTHAPSADDRVILTNLASWRADRGSKGELFDGISTFSFDGPIVHIELGLISDTDPLLKRLAGYIVSNYVRNTITRLPRNTKKLVLFEEIGNFLSYDDAEHIISDFFERGRKYQACVVIIGQQIATIRKELRDKIINNTSLAMLFRQEGESNARALQEGFGLPDSTTLELTKLPRPSKEMGASFICWQAGDSCPAIHQAYSIASPEMLYVVDSSGDKYEARQKALGGYEDVLEGIRIEANKNA